MHDEFAWMSIPLLYFMPQVVSFVHDKLYASKAWAGNSLQHETKLQVLPTPIPVWDAQELESLGTGQSELSWEIPFATFGSAGRVCSTPSLIELWLAGTSQSEPWEWAPPGGLISSEQQACLNAVSINPRLFLPPFLFLFLSACPGEHPYLIGVYHYALLPWVEIHDDRSNRNAL